MASNPFLVDVDDATLRANFPRESSEERDDRTRIAGEILQKERAVATDPNEIAALEREIATNGKRIGKVRGVNPFLEEGAAPTKSAAPAGNPFLEDVVKSAPVSDVAKSGAAGVVSGVGAIARGAGEGFREGGELLARGANAALGTDLRAENPLKSVADWLDQKAQGIADTRSAGGRRAEQQSTPRGDLLDAIKNGDFSKVDLGENPTVEGYANLAANVFGQMVPIVLGTAFTKSPALPGAVLGGSQGGGAAAKQASDQILGMTPEQLAVVPLYIELVKSGVPDTQARQQTADAASRMAFLLTTPVSAAGGALTAKILHGGAAALLPQALAKNAAARIAGSTAGGIAEESLQEVAEGVMTNAGQNIATGTKTPLGEGSNANAVLGAMGGAGPGAVGGVVGRQQQEAPPPQRLVLDFNGAQVQDTQGLTKVLAGIPIQQRFEAIAAALKLDPKSAEDVQPYRALYDVVSNTQPDQLADVLGEQLWDAPAQEHADEQKASQEAAALAQEEARIREGTDPAPAAPVPANALVRMAKKRLDELHKITADSQSQLERIGPEGQPVFTKGTGLKLTPQQQEEYDYLSANIENPEALAGRYGVKLASESPTKKPAVEKKEPAPAPVEKKAEAKPSAQQAVGAMEADADTILNSAKLGTGTQKSAVSSTINEASKTLAREQDKTEKAAAAAKKATAAAPSKERPSQAAPSAPAATTAKVAPTAKVATVEESRRAKDFSESGNYEIKVGGKQRVFYRDPENKWWYEADTGKHHSEAFLGFTKVEAVERLNKRYASGKVVNEPAKVAKAELGPKGKVAVEKSKAKEAKTAAPEVADEKFSPAERAMVKEARDVLKKNPGTKTPVAIVQREMGVPHDVAKQLVAHVNAPAAAPKKKQVFRQPTKAEQAELQQELEEALNDETETDLARKREPRRNERRVSLGLGAGGGTTLSSAMDGREISVEQARGVIEEAARRSGVEILGVESGVGAYLQYVEGSLQIDTKASEEQIDAFMAMLGYALQQTEMISARALHLGENSAIDVFAPQFADLDKAKSFFNVFLLRQPRDGSGDPVAPGFQQARVDERPALRFLNFAGRWTPEQQDAILQSLYEAADETGIEIHDHLHFPVEFRSVKHDWTADQKGTSYLHATSDALGDGAAQELERRYDPASTSARVAEGDDFARTTGSQAAATAESSVRQRFAADDEARAYLVGTIGNHFSRIGIERAKAGAMLDLVAPGSPEARQAQNLAKSFGFDLRFFSNRNPTLFDFDGVAPAGSKYIFVNTNNERPVLAVAGHELLHKMRQSDEVAYRGLVDALSQYWDANKRTAFEQKLASQVKEEGSNPLANTKLEEEFMADLVGEAFTDPAFFEMLAERQPSLFQKIVDAILKLLNSVLDFTQDPSQSQYVTDVQRARAVVADAFAKWAADRVAADDSVFRGRVFRGSQAGLAKADFERERLGGATGYAPSGMGVFFSTSEKNASKYGRVENFEVTLRNPYRVKVDALPMFETVDDAFDFRQKLRTQGHDGVIIEASHLGAGYDHIIAFDPSAVDLARPIAQTQEQYERRFDDLLALVRDGKDREANKQPVMWVKMPRSVRLSMFRGVRLVLADHLGGMFVNVRGDQSQYGAVPDEVLRRLPDLIEQSTAVYAVGQKRTAEVRVVLPEQVDGKDVVAHIADRGNVAEVTRVELRPHKDALDWAKRGLRMRSPGPESSPAAAEVSRGVQSRAEPAGSATGVTIPQDTTVDFARMTAKQRMAAGQQVNDLFTNAAQQYINDPNKERSLRIPQAQRALDVINKWVGSRMSPLGMLPEEGTYLVQRNVAMGLIAQANEMASTIAKVFEKANDAEKAAVYQFWTTAYAPASAITNPELRQQAIEVKELIEQIGEKLVKRGLLEGKIFEENRGRYLPRLYLKHLLNEGDWRAIGAGKKPSDLGYTKRRKDIPEEVRLAVLGEIRDPGFLGAMAVGKPLRDIALMDFLEAISKNEEWVWKPSITQHNGMQVSVKWVANEIARIREQISYYKDPAVIQRAQQEISDLEATLQQASQAQPGKNPDGFKEVPDAPRYGLLRGLMVREEIWDDLVGSSHVNPDGAGWAEHFFGYGGISTKAVNLWKTSKVALNPPGQIRNFISNLMLMHLSGVPMHLIPVRLAQAIKEVRTEGRYYKIAMKYGISVGTFGAQEMYRIEQEFLKDKGAGGPFALMRYAKLLASKAGDVYQLTESIGKIAKIIDEMERRKTDETTAVIEANKWLFDYSLVPKSVRYLRNAPIGAPFVTFYYKLAPRLLEVAAKYPWRFAPYVGLAYILPQLVAGAVGADADDLEKLKRALPEWLRDKQHVYVLPWKDESGRWQFLDLSYLMPWTMFTDAARQAKEGKVSELVKTSGLLTGPIVDMVSAIRTNKDAFTGQDIANAGDPAMLQVGSWMTWLYNLAMPPVLTNRGLIGPDFGNPAYNFGGRIHQALAGSTNKFGEPRATETQAILNAVGISMYPVNPESSRLAEMQRMMMEITETKRLFLRKMSDQGMSEATRQHLTDVYMAEMERRMGKLKKFADESEVPAALR